MSSTFDPPDLPDRLGSYPTLDRPDDWPMTAPWRRAQTERDQGGPINDYERMVWLDGSDGPHRVVWALEGRTLRAECDCSAGTYRGWCSHLASLWWRWVRSRIDVHHVDTGRSYDTPPAWLRLDDDDDGLTDDLTPAELDAYLHVELGTSGKREFARSTNRSHGTIGTLLARARRKVADES